MSITTNFNELVFLKKFNNYFNRKIIGGPFVNNYVKGDPLEEEEISLTILGSEFIDERTAIVDLDIPINKDIEIVSITFSDPSYSVFLTEYNILKQKLTVIVGSDVFPTLEMYITFKFVNYDYEIKQDVNFNPNDGILTKLIINDIDFEPDYLLVLDSETKEIVNRWFVLEMVRTRLGQYELHLKRDVVFDNIDSLMESPVFVQKGMLEEDDPFVVNDEGMSVNQIKSYEGLLQDITKCAWIVGYIAKNTPNTSVSDAETGISTTISAGRINTQDQEFDMFAIPYGDLIIDDAGAGSFDNAKAYNLLAATEIARTLDANCYDIQLLPYCPVPNVIADENRIELDMAYGGEHVGFEYIKQTLGGGTKTLRFTRSDFIKQPVLPPAQPTALTTPWLGASSLGVGEGAVLSNFTTVNLVINTGHTVSASYELSADATMVRIRISPFSDHNFPTELVLDFSFSYTGTSDTKIGVILYCKTSTFKTRIMTPPDSLIPEFDNLTKKESSNLLKFRFVSPNYQGTFEINGAKNNTPNENDIDTEIMAYCTYKPYTPFIKVAPEFDFLYGKNYEDSRGLICGGDFSLPRSTDAWQTFQLNNKNYQNIFNREIQNMDFNYSLDMRKQIVSSTVGAIGGAATGAAAGAMVGGPVGAAVGGAVGGITSAVGGVVDTITMAERYKENKDFAIDKFNYQLGNIKALPYTLTKVGAFDICSKIWPILEIYHCTIKELEAFRNKIKYESMTVMRIDKISNFYHKFDELCYFKGELIRNDEIACDNHVLMAIYEELLKGVYI